MRKPQRGRAEDRFRRAEQKYRWEITYFRFGVASRPSAETQI
jgi:hypothetical protein